VEVAVLGTGNWEDIDLVDIAARSSKVVYLDAGHTGSQTAVQNISGVLANKISVKNNVDFVGLDKLQFQERFQGLLEDGANAEKLVVFLRETADQVENAAAAAEQDVKRYSVVISSAVYTQLFYIDALLLLAPYMDRYAASEVGKVTGQLAQVRSRMVEAYNRYLFSLVKPGGYIVIWTEMMKVDEHTQAFMDELYMERTEKARVRRLFTAFGKYGMEAAIVGLKHAFDGMNPDKVHFTTWLWPLSAEKQFVAAGLLGELK
jgi:hypothetical protein